MTGPTDLASYIEARRARIDAALDAALPSPPDCPALIAEAMRYSLQAGGKRLRPLLTLAAAEAVGEQLRPPVPADDAVDLALPAACAIEMIHTYSLVHDDLPAMDDDQLRRGRPTAHVVYGDGIAILAGDGLLTEAFRVLVRPESTPRSDPARGGVDAATWARRSLRAVERVAEAAGAEGMVGGQVVDLEAAGRAAAARPMDAGEVTAMHARKTGALIRASAVAGAIMVGASGELEASVDAFAAELGLAFQIVDDILDVEGSADEIGKTTGKDAAAGKPTYPSVYGMDESRRRAAACIDRARAALDATGLAGRLPDLAAWVVSRTR